MAVGSRGGPWLVSLVMWSNCMRFVGDGGITVRELEDLARTKTNLNGMQGGDTSPSKAPRALRWGDSRNQERPAGAGGVAAAVRRSRGALAGAIWQRSDPTASGIPRRADQSDGRRAA